MLLGDLRRTNGGTSGRILPVVLTFSVACFLVGCDLPRDPEGTLERVRGGTLRVGVSENEPWVKKVNGQPAGVEVELVRRLADELGAEVEWKWGMVEDHFEALEAFELDLAAAGLTTTSPWTKRIGLTQPYRTTRYLVGVSPQAPPDVPRPLAEVEGLPVAVEAGSMLVDKLDAKGAEPIRVDSLTGANALVAAADWKLSGMRFGLTDIHLMTENHALAAPPGENAWLVYVERFLRRNEPLVHELLAREASL